MSSKSTVSSKKASNMAKSGDICFTKVCLLYEILSLIMLLSRNSDKHIWRLKNRSLNIGSCSWFPALCPSFCALSSLWWLPSVKCPTKCMPCRFALDRVNYEMSSLQLAQLSDAEHLLCGKQNRGKGVSTFVDYRTQAQESCYERIRCTWKQVRRGRCKCFKAACCAQPCAYVVRTVTASRQGFLTGKEQLR